MIDKSCLLKSHGSLYLEFIPKDGLFHKMLLLSLMGFKLVDVTINVCLMTLCITAYSIPKHLFCMYIYIYISYNEIIR